MANLPAAKMAHAQALVAWNGMEYEDAVKLAESSTCEELEAQSYATGSIMSAKAGIEKHLLGGKEIDVRYLTGEAIAPEGYFDAFRAQIETNLGQEGLMKGVMSILGDIHDNWVSTNAKKYNRDADKADKRLFQHLPTELIGVDEVAKDLMFLSPILGEMGINVGQMTQAPWGEFVPTPEVATAYSELSKGYMVENGLTAENLAGKMPEIIDSYAPLHGDSAMDIARHAYMMGRTELLAGQVAANVAVPTATPADVQ